MSEILIVDDDPTMVLLERKILEGAGHIVHACTTLLEVEDYLKCHMPHAIILDINLGANENGLDLLRIKTLSKIISMAKVIIVSSLDDLKSISDALSLGADDYIVKPINSRLLLQKISKHLRQGDILEYIAREDARPEVKVQIDCELVAVSEQNIIIEGPIKLSLGEKIDCRGETLNSLIKPHCRLISRRPTLPPRGQGQLANMLEIVGANEETYQAIRRFSKLRRK